MASFRRARQTQDQQAPMSLLASAVLVKQSRIRTVPEQKEWQARAWEAYDNVGELRFAAQWISNALSRAGLHVRTLATQDSRTEPVRLEDVKDADPRASVPLDELFGGAIGHGEMLSRLATHLTVGGESYLIGFDPQGGGPRRWLICSSDEIVRSGPKDLKVRLPEDDRLVPVPLENAVVIRLWRPHPRRAWEADSPVRAALPVLKELVDLTAHITATVESRLAGAGLLVVPESATLPSPLSQGGEPLHEDPAMATLIDAMITPIGDRDSSAAVVPVLVRIPDAATGKIQWISFATKLDERILELREASIRRFATIVDIPAEVLTGIAEANRWNAWKISEDAVRLHLEPLLALICEALTVKYLWPALEQLGVENFEDYVVHYDVSHLIQHANRGPESQNLWDHGLVKNSTVRTHNGFTEDDAPDPAEQRRNLLTQLAVKGVDPQVVAPYLKALGIDIDLPAVPEQRQADIDPESANPTRGTRDRGRPPIPAPPDARTALPANTDARERAAVVASVRPPVDDLNFAAMELGAVRALELAGKRLLNNGSRSFRGQLRRVDPWEIHTHIPAGDVDEVLHGAYTLLELCLPDRPCIHTTIDRYVRERLSQQLPHDRNRLISMLASAGCLSGGGSRAIA